MSRPWTLLTVCVGTFMLLIDITVVNVALPDIQRDLGASFTDLEWVVDAYTLGLAALLLTAGSLGDRLGTREVYAVGLGVFTLSSLACGLAHSSLALNVSRGVQGIGGALMFATSLSLLAQAFTGRDRGTAFGIYGATSGLAVAVGPLVGGALTESLGWQWIFFVNVPIGIAVVAALLLRLPRSRPTVRARIDVPGLVTFSGALALLVLALLRGQDLGWGSGTVVGCLVASALLLVAFVVLERRQRAPMLDLSLFRVPTFVGAAVSALALHGTIFSMFLYLTLYLQNVLGYGPLQAGLRFLPLSVLAFVTAAVTGPLTERVPRRVLLAVGLVLVGVSQLLMRAVDAGSAWTVLVPGFLVGGVGIGMVNPTLASTAIDVVEPRRSGMAAGINSTFRQVGTAVGIAGLGALLTSRVRGDAVDGLTALGVPASSAKAAASAAASGRGGDVVSRLPDPRAAGGVLRSAFVAGLDEILLVSGVLALVGAVLALALVRSADQARAATPPSEAAAVPA